MRQEAEIRVEIKKVERAKQNAERKLERCNERLEELQSELIQAGGVFKE